MYLVYKPRPSPYGPHKYSPQRSSNLVSVPPEASLQLRSWNGADGRPRLIPRGALGGGEQRADEESVPAADI